MPSRCWAADIITFGPMRCRDSSCTTEVYQRLNPRRQPGTSIRGDVRGLAASAVIVSKNWIVGKQSSRAVTAAADTQTGEIHTSTLLEGTRAPHQGFATVSVSDDGTPHRIPTMCYDLTRLPLSGHCPQGFARRVAPSHAWVEASGCNRVRSPGSALRADPYASSGCASSFLMLLSCRKVLRGVGGGNAPGHPPSARLNGPIRCCASSARATRNDWRRCHSLFSTRLTNPSCGPGAEVCYARHREARLPRQGRPWSGRMEAAEPLPRPTRRRGPLERDGQHSPGIGSNGKPRQADLILLPVTGRKAIRHSRVTHSPAAGQAAAMPLYWPFSDCFGSQAAFAGTVGA
jgi:hypothetical protein